MTASVAQRAFPSVDVTGKRVFLSPRPFKSFRSMKQVEPDWPSGKPHGLWYSVGDEWASWCRDEMPAWSDAAKYLYEIELDESRILRLTSVDDIYNFSREFCGTPRALEETARRSEEIFTDVLGGFVDPDPELRERGRLRSVFNTPFWDTVALGFDGIEIAPYQFDCRFNVSWYYAWDVASGCIWNKRAFKSVRLLEKR